MIETFAVIIIIFLVWKVYSLSNELNMLSDKKDVLMQELELKDRELKCRDKLILRPRALSNNSQLETSPVNVSEIEDSYKNPCENEVIQCLTSTIESLKSELALKKVEIESRDTNLANKTKESNALRELIAARSDEVKNLRSRLAQLDQLLSSKTNNIDQITTIKDKVDSREKELIAVNNELDHLKGIIKSVESQLYTANQEVDKLKKEISRHKEEIQRWKKIAEERGPAYEDFQRREREKRRLMEEQERKRQEALRIVEEKRKEEEAKAEAEKKRKEMIAQSHLISSKKVSLGSKVTIKNLKKETIESYFIVSQEYADTKLNKISINTPVAQSLLNCRIGNRTSIHAPSGYYNVEIMDIDDVMKTISIV